MRINILIFFLLFIFSSNTYSKEINLSCDLSKFFMKEYLTQDEKQIPLSKVDPTYLKKVSLSFDIENKKFLGSNLIFPGEYKSVLFTDEEIYFMSKGFKDKESYFYYDSRLNRLTGELTRVIRVTERVIKERLEKKKPNAGLGFKQTEVYQCKAIDKLF